MSNQLLRLLVAGCLALALPAALAAAPSFDHAVQLHTAGHLEEALREYRAVAAERGRSDPAEAGAALNNACVIQMNLGEYRAALPDCREALRLRRAEEVPEPVAETLNNLGWVLQGLGETAEAERDFREALEINRRLGHAEAEAINLSNLGSLAIATGHYSTALDLHTQAEALAARHQGEPWSAGQRRIARLNQGVVLEKVGAYREALDIYIDLYKGLLAPDRRAALLVNTGVIYRNLGDPVRAEAAFREGIEAYREAGDTAALSNAWLNLGLAEHLNLERPAGAEAAFREALRLAGESGDRTEEVQDLFYLGRLLLERGRLDEAGAVFRRCLAAAEASGSAEGRWSAREGLGRIARARGDLRGALTHFERALDEIEQVRSSIARPRRAGYFGDKRAVYAAAVDTLGELDYREPGKGWGERALEIVQRAKARDLLDALGAGRRPVVPLGANALRSRVGNGAVLEYFLGERDLFLWVIRGNGIRFRNLGPHRPVLEAVVSVHRALSHGEAPPPTAVSALSRVLLGQAGTLPRDDAPLRIAPDGALRYLPFELLEDPRDRSVPLVEGTTVSYLPSASTLRGGRSPELEGVRLLGVGNPQLSRSGFGPAGPRELLVERFGLAPLAAAEREIGEAARLLGGRSRVITGEKATESAFRQAVARGARVVHLATHTVIDERPGRGAAILLAPGGGGDGGNSDDGLLTPDEIAGLDDRSALTVLAACRTALGPGEDGQALSSLTGSFLAAGSQSVVATLWDVGDTATAAFMEQLYWQLGQGLPPTEALRAAKRRFRSDPRWNRPDLWAGYVLVGEAPRVVPRQIPWVWVAGIVAVALLAGVVWRWRATGRRGRQAKPLQPARCAILTKQPAFRTPFGVESAKLSG